MNDQDVDESLDTLLRSHLTRELDPHVGSALQKFDAERTIRPDFSQGLTRTSSIGGLPSRIRYAAAAVLMLGVGITSSVVYRNIQRAAPGQPIAVQDKPAPYTDAVLSSWTQTYDQGTVMIDPQTPARMLRRVQYEKTDWKDASGQWQSKIEIPHEDVILVDMLKQ